MTMIELISSALQPLAIGFGTVQAGRMMLRHRGVWLYQPLFGALMCMLLGGVFWSLHVFLRGIYPMGFSVSDLAYIGFFGFLLVAAGGRRRQSGQGVRGRTRGLAWLALAVVLLLHAAYYALAGGLWLNILYAVPLAALAYSTVCLLDMDTRAMRVYHGTVLLLIALLLLLYLMSALVLYGLYYVFDFTLYTVYACLPFAARRGMAG